MNVYGHHHFVYDGKAEGWPWHYLIILPINQFIAFFLRSFTFICLQLHSFIFKILKLAGDLSLHFMGRKASKEKLISLSSYRQILQLLPKTLLSLQLGEMTCSTVQTCPLHWV